LFDGIITVLAIEAGEYNIRVNCISPAAVRGDRILNAAKAKAEALGVDREDLLVGVVVLEGIPILRLVEVDSTDHAQPYIGRDEGFTPRGV